VESYSVGSTSQKLMGNERRQRLLAALFVAIIATAVLIGHFARSRLGVA